MTQDNIIIDRSERNMEIPSTPSAVVLGRHEMLSRMLNAYLRETGQHDPFVQHATRPDISVAIMLPRTSQTIYGSLLHRSSAGHHVYGDTLYTSEIVLGQPEQWRTLSFEQITTMLLEEISFLEPNAEIRALKRIEFEQMVYNSLQHLTSYLEYALNAKPPAVLDFIYLEQVLLCGHPFHPTPKSLVGFSVSDSSAYSPEFGVAFPLSCFAVAPQYVYEDWLDPDDEGIKASWVPEEMIEAARSTLQAEFSDYIILPCHPWQAAYLKTLDPVKDLLHQKLLFDLGSTGPLVYPTSSVRTVWNPKECCFYKLSLHIRITNFIRENSEEQLLRTLDASRIVQTVQSRQTINSLQILLEKGYRTLKLPEANKSIQGALTAGFSMILREATESCHSTKSPPFVVASLLEVLPGESLPLLFRAVHESSLSTNGAEESWIQPDWYVWLRQYLDLSMTPILQLYVDSGISLEAHVQNSMLSLENGMPSAFVIRDLEGISVNRSFARKQGWVGTILEEDSPVLYTEEEARYRLKYYFFVNHLSHLIQRLAFYTGQQEQLYWRVVRNTLEELGQISVKSSHMEEVIRDLLTAESLPAKANLLSRFHQCGETPLYVEIPNPIFYC